MVPAPIIRTAAYRPGPCSAPSRLDDCPGADHCERLVHSSLSNGSVGKSRTLRCSPPRRRHPSLNILAADGQGHREADSAALVDLVLDGQPAPRLGAGDQARGRGVQLDERGRVRAPLLRGPRRAREPRHLAAGRQARRGVLRGRALRAAAGELLPAGDRVHRRRAGRAAHGARPARRRVRLRRAASPRAPAGLVGPLEPAERGRAGADRRPALHRTAAAASSRSGSRRSRPRSRAARRSSSATTRCSATRSPTARSTPTTSSSATASSI